MNQSQTFLHIVTGLRSGGAEKVVLDLATNFKQKGHKAIVVSISKEDRLLSRFLDNEIEVYVLGLGLNVFKWIKALRSVLKIIKKEKIELIHAHMFHSLILTRIIKFFLPKIKVVFTSHNVFLGSEKREKIVKKLKGIRDADILFSEDMKRDIYLPNSSIIPNGIDTTQYYYDSEKKVPFTFLCIGRIQKVKNHIKIVDFVEELKDKFDFVVEIVGEGPLKEEVEAYALKKGVSDKIKFLGYRSDIAALCSKAHVFILPSLWEGLPISLLEAGASTLPIISTDVGSISTLIKKDTGYLIDVEDFPSTMEYVFNNYEEALEKAKVLNSNIRRDYDLAKNSSLHLELYNNVISKN